MKPKPAYDALNSLINDEWKTRTTVVADKDGIVKFRGFKGGYRAIWKDLNAQEQIFEFYLSQDGVIATK
jgi:hypothetical protein